MPQTIAVDGNILQKILKRLDKLNHDVEIIKEHTAQDIPMVDKETNRQIGLSLKDLAEGRYIDVEPTDKEGLDKLAGLK